MSAVASTMWTTLAVGVGGSVGAICRYWLGHYFTHQIGVGVYGTGAANLLGSFFFGLLWSLTEHSPIGAVLRLLLLSGFAGAFTTFSTLMFETLGLVQQDRWSFALANVVIQTCLGVALVLLGLRIGQGVGGP